MNKYKKYVWGLLLLAASPLFTACDNDDDNLIDEVETLITIASGQTSGGEFHVKVLATDSLFEGYNRLKVVLTEPASGSPVNGATVKFHPLMDMMTKVHAAPVEHPVADVKGGEYTGAVVFIMPSSGMMGWSMKVAVEKAGVMDTVNFDLPVVRNLDEVKKVNVVSDIDGTVYFVSLIQPASPKVGINNLEFSVHYKETMMAFPAAEDLTIEIEPEMPSMDHGSPNNINPVHTQMGHYEGKVNFTMTGWWRVHVNLKKGGEIVTDKAYFDITFQ